MKHYETKLIKKVEKHLSNSKNSGMLMRAILKYIDQNSEILYDNGIQVRPIFHPKFDEEIVNLCGLTIDEVKEVYLNSPAVQSPGRNKVFDNSIYHALLMAVYVYNKTKKKKEVELANIFLVIRFYSALHRKFLTFEPRREIMDYTMEKMNNKFDIKSLGNLYKALEKLSETVLNTYSRNLLTKTDDESLVMYLVNIRTRVNSMVKNITNEFMANWKEGNYLNISRETGKDLDGQDVAIERENVSSTVMVASSAFLMWFNSNPTDYNTIDIVARQTDTAASTIRHVIEKMKEEDANKVGSIAENLFVLLQDDNKRLNSICSTFWVPFVLNQFSKSNTENVSIINLKDVLTYFLNKFSTKFAGTKRDATRMNYRRAILLYFAIIIQKQRCN